MVDAGGGMPLSCEEVTAALEPYLDDDLDRSVRQRVAEHLELCATCSAELELARSVAETLRSLPELACPAATTDRVFEIAGNQAAQDRQQADLGAGPRVVSIGSVERAPAASRDVSATGGRFGWLQAAAVLAALALGAVVALRMVDGDGIDPSSRSRAVSTAAESLGTAPDSVSEAELAQAQADLQFALAYFQGLTEKAGLVLRDEVIVGRVVQPTRKALLSVGDLGARNPLVPAMSEENS